MKKIYLRIICLCLILCALAISSCTSPTSETESASSQEQSTENVLETSSEEPSSSTEESDVSQLTSTDESRPEVSDDTSTEESQPEISDDPSGDVSQPEDEVPEEIVEPIYDKPTPVESTAELLFRFEIGPDGLFEYNSLFYDFADYANMTLPGYFLVDKNMDFFILDDYGDNTLCLDGTDKSPKPLESITSFLGDVNKSNSATRLFEKTSDGKFVLHKTYGSVEFASENAFIILRQIPDSRKIYIEKQEVYQYEYYVYDGQGTPLHRVMLTKARAMVPSPCAIPFTCHSHKEMEIHTSLRYRPYTVQINNLTWEGLLDYEVLWMDESTCYLVACFPNHGEIHKITLGSTNQERIPQTEENSKKPKLEEVFALQLVQRDELNAFLQDPQSFVFNHTDKRDEDDIPAFITMVYERFYLREDFLELYNNRSVMEAYLTQQGVTCTVSKVYAFDSPALPITLYVQTQEGNDYFITAEDNRNSYTYTFYTETEFCSIFMRKEGKVVLNGQTLELSHAPVFYSTYVDVPVIALLKAMGTTMNELSDDSIIGTLGSQECFIDLDCATVSYGLYSFPSTSESYGYIVDKELMLRNDYYSDFLRYFCPGAEIRIDLETNTVYITK